MKRTIHFGFIFVLFGLMFVVIPYVYSACPTSVLEVSPQPVQPGQPIKLTFPWDRANNIEDQTTGGLQQEAGHVDNTGGGSIHFQNGSNNWYIFHAGPCGTYKWNHQSGGCSTSTTFSVCGSASAPTTAPTVAPTPTEIPQVQQEEPTAEPTVVPPTNTPQTQQQPTAVPRTFTIPTAEAVQNIPTIQPTPEPTGQSAQFQLPSISMNISTVLTPISSLGKTGISLATTSFTQGKDFFMKIITAFLNETSF